MEMENKKLRDVANIAAQIMSGQTVTEKLHPNQQKLDVHEPEKDELTAKDFEMLRKGKKAEVKKEEVDQAAEFVLEYESKDGKFVHRAKPGVYGGTKDEKHAVDTLKGPKMKELSDIEAEKKKKKKMSEMVATYQEQGLKGLFASLVKEEPDNEQFTKELEAQKAKNAGEGKKAEVAKAAVQAVQEEEFEVVMDELNGYAEATIEERSMTEPEMKKKEEIVKSMKKGISGFKARYGDRAKEVMYATATKQAMKD